MNLKVTKLQKSYPGPKPIPVLKDVSLDFRKGELFVLIGRSGCGKSTLLRCLNGLEVFDRGEVKLDSIRIRGAAEEGTSFREFEDSARQIRRSIGMVFQGFHLFPHYTLLENVTLGPKLVLGRDVQSAESTARSLLERVGLQGLESRYPSQLSGGQQQRGAIARALALSPQVLLYDEPTSALDPELRDEVLNVMRALKADGITQILVTHEMRFAREVGDRAAFIDAGSVVECRAAKEFFDSPGDPRLQQFLKRSLS